MEETALSNRVDQLYKMIDDVNNRFSGLASAESLKNEMTSMNDRLDREIEKVKKTTEVIRTKVAELDGDTQVLKASLDKKVQDGGQMVVRNPLSANKNEVLILDVLQKQEGRPWWRR